MLNIFLLSKYLYMTKVLMLLPALFISFCLSAQTKIAVEDASKHIGETVIVCDKIYEGKLVKNSTKQTAVLKMGNSNSDHKLTIIIKPENQKNFIDNPGDYYTDKDVCVTGRVIQSNGKPAIVISKPADIQIGTE